MSHTPHDYYGKPFEAPNTPAETMKKFVEMMCRARGQNGQAFDAITQDGLKFYGEALVAQLSKTPSADGAASLYESSLNPVGPIMPVYATREEK